MVTFGYFGAGVSTDEYRYAVQAEEWLRIMRRFSTSEMRELVVLYPLVPVVGALGTLVTGADSLRAGQLVQLVCNALSASMTFALARAGGLDRSSGALAGAVMCILPVSWQHSSKYLPDSQAMMFSTITLIGALRGVQGHGWSWPIAGLGLGMSFLTKVHLAVVLLPPLAVLLVLWIRVRQPLRADVLRACAALALGLGLAVSLSASGLGIPRSIVLTPPYTGDPVTRSTDGLPGPSFEQGGRRALESYTRTIQRPVRLEWFEWAFRLSDTSTAVTVFALAGAVALGVRRPSCDGLSLAVRGSALVLGAMAMAQLVVDPADHGRVLAAIGVALVIAGRLLGTQEGERGNQSVAWVRAVLLASLSTYLVATLTFFSLDHGSVDPSPRQFLPVMPALAIAAALGVTSLAGGLMLLTARLPSWMLAGVFVVAAALLAPTTLATRTAIGGVALLTALIAQVVLPRHPCGRRYGLMVAIAAVGILAGSSTLNTLARARAFQGMPEDPAFREVIGGLRIATFSQWEHWLRASVPPGAVVLTSKPYQVAYHAGLGWPGFVAMRMWKEEALDRRQYLRDEVLRTASFDWIIEFNQFALTPASPEARAFAEDLEWLRSRPYLALELLVISDQDQPLFYAIRRTSSHSEGEAPR